MTQYSETIDSIPDDILLHVICNPNEFAWSFLAMKIILTRLNLKISMHDRDKTVIQECCNELRNLLKKSANVPNSRNDLNLIISLIK